MDSAQRQLGNFLRIKREALTPKDVGLPTMGRRRTPGLRREEVAELAGISVDWYLRLEQGRDILPSNATIEALSKVLRLNKAERAHFLRLCRSGGTKRVFRRETVPSSVANLIQSLTTPAYLTGSRYDILCTNAAAQETFGAFFDTSALTGQNLLYQMFVSPDVRRGFVHWEKDARDLLEGFRMSYDFWAHAPEFRDLVQSISERSPEFCKWWKQHSIQPKASGEKLILHKRWGKIRLPYSTFQVAESPKLMLVLYGQRIPGC